MANKKKDRPWDGRSRIPTQQYKENYNEIFKKASGLYIYTESGKKVFDFTGGLGVLNHGHNHPRILNARIEGQKKYDISSTPTIVINKKKIKGPISFKNIEKALKKII